MTTTLIGIPAQNLADCWNDVRHLVDSACAHSNGKYQAVDVLRSLLRGDMQLWGAISESGIEAIAIGEIVNYPRIKMYRVLCSTGDGLKDWVDHLDGIETWAKLQGCLDFEHIVRPGWERVLKGKGYKKTHSVLNKTLTTGSIN